MGGSTRLPASYMRACGHAAFDRADARDGMVSRPRRLDFQVIGPFARTMRDMGLLYGVLAGPDTRDPYSAAVSARTGCRDRPALRIGWFTAIGDEGATPEVAASIAAAVDGLPNANCELAAVPRRTISTASALFTPR